MSRRQAPAAPNRRQNIKAERQKRQARQRLITTLIVAGIALIIAGLLIYPTLRNNLGPAGDFVEVSPEPRPNADANNMGDPNAPVKIVEYSDFQCPYCKLFNDETEQQIVDAYVATGKVYFTFIPYGPAGTWIGPESESAARAALCAGDQGKFWEYKSILFANHTGENVGDFTNTRLKTFAESLGLNMTDFNSCYGSNKYDQQLTQGLVQGQQAGVGGTPSFTVNGKLIEGAQPFSAFQQEIESALSASQ